ncbi:hypothetical protein NDU88_010957 [Pleurodeles waltl]|uniref:Uncharacterized protein n=1 Tax=Pleurodeles waltl TaxID=8319 RepID=A0AAV7RZQ3_PLEWA|nr:hypothetical protein NDU88_010957 [Pleurodeles waltl]
MVPSKQRPLVAIQVPTPTKAYERSSAHSEERRNSLRGSDNCPDYQNDFFQRAKSGIGFINLSDGPHADIL